MKSISLVILYCSFAIAGCGRSSQVPLHVDAKTGEALKTALADAQIITLEHRADLDSITNLVALLDQEARLKPFKSYGASNLFFNPNVSIWKDVAISNHEKPSTVAIVIHIHPQKYSAIYFDGRLAAMDRPPADWCR
jgi:hypothetical protein